MSDLDGAAIGGIVVGAVIFAFLVVLFWVWYYCYEILPRKQRDPAFRNPFGMASATLQGGTGATFYHPTYPTHTTATAATATATYPGSYYHPALASELDASAAPPTFGIAPQPQPQPQQQFFPHDQVMASPAELYYYPPVTPSMAAPGSPAAMAGATTTTTYYQPTYAQPAYMAPQPLSYNFAAAPVLSYSTYGVFPQAAAPLPTLPTGLTYTYANTTPTAAPMVYPGM